MKGGSNPAPSGYYRNNCGVTTGTVGLTISLNTYHQFSFQFIQYLQQVTQTILTLQEQIDSLVAVYSKTNSDKISLQLKKAAFVASSERSAASMSISQVW